MPELDADVARFVGLVLLGLIVIVMLLTLASLSRTRKEITHAIEELRSMGPDREAQQTTTAFERADARETEPVARAEPFVEPAPFAAEPEPMVAEPEPEHFVAEPEPEPVAEPEPEPMVAEPEPFVAEPEPAPFAEAPTAVSPGPGVEPIEEPVPAAATPLTQEPAAEPFAQPAAVEPAPAATAAEEPQEQPFERDGRWWFRRGEELLVYDEASGQWISGPHDAAPVAARPPAQSTATTISSITGATQVAQQTEQAQAEPEAVGFWKCPSCGAVNGSTATSCRMCFASRP